MMSGAAVADDLMLRLIGRLYDAALDERLWSGLAPQIAAAFASESAIVKMHGADGCVDLLEMTDNLVVADSERAWAEYWHRNDLWVERAVTFGLSRIITSQDLVSPTEEKRTGFYQEWLRRLDIHHMVGVVFAAGEGGIGVLGIHRSRAAGRYADADRRKVALLLPHLERALQLGRRFAGTTLMQTAALDTLDQLDSGVLVLDRSRRIVYANALAEDVLRGNPDIGIKDGRLIARQPVLNGRLESLVRAGLNTAFGGLSRPPPALAIHREGRSPLMVAVSPLRPGWSRSKDQQPLVAVFLRDAGHSAVAADQLRGLFGLTRMEAAIAADLARGWTMARIAEAHRIGPATVRSHVKKILVKTGTNRQAEAVALFARSVAPIRPITPPESYD